MQTTLVQQALVVQFNFNGHHKWASCPLCLQVGPQKEKVLEHLNMVHTLPGQEYHLVEAHDVRAGLNTFWLAVCQFFPEKVRQTTPEQDLRAVQAMKKARALPKNIEQRLDASVNEAVRKKQVEATKPGHRQPDCRCPAGYTGTCGPCKERNKLRMEKLRKEKKGKKK